MRPSVKGVRKWAISSYRGTGSKRFHAKPAPLRAVQIRMRVTTQPRGIRSTPPFSHPPLIPRRLPGGTYTSWQFVAVAAAGLVGLLGSDEDRRSGSEGWLPVYQALGARGVAAAAGADGAQLHDLVGLGEEAGHRAEGLSPEVHVEAGDDHLVSRVGQAPTRVHYPRVEELGL